ncbi:hypothetical protein AK830_g3349 [Neonectria ditissima]|uniref:Cyanovirin-N domain-containing protein n=1 Tax=Neonectria ditissima TaxID=78410 RepID=A0A0P7B943_9HYPO|nr:hypothetical protein AK830_g3349 [Neonectria ditissima]
MFSSKLKMTGLLLALANLIVLASPKRILAIPVPVPNKIDLEERILFGWCREKKVTETCEDRHLDHGACSDDFNSLDIYLDDNIETVNVTGGRCVIWERNDCGGDHTGMIMGTDVVMENVCPGYPWPRKASSLKCCGGDANAMFCANPGNKPKCTD